MFLALAEIELSIRSAMAVSIEYPISLILSIKSDAEGSVFI